MDLITFDIILRFIFKIYSIVIIIVNKNESMNYLISLTSIISISTSLIEIIINHNIIKKNIDIKSYIFYISILITLIGIFLSGILSIYEFNIYILLYSIIFCIIIILLNYSLITNCRSRVIIENNIV